ncbi:MAG TPA: hypothetical protein VHX86_15475 [Tepidisphaeraceae bacterium]|jgi:hypothetical protein|nr:hypothetical protein [Tepidisphaeraceae bacterium]
MTARLEEALQRLTPQGIQRLTEFAESLARMESAKAGEAHLGLNWAGAASDAYPEYRSGVDAAHAALAMMRQALDRELPQ